MAEPPRDEPLQPAWWAAVHRLGFDRAVPGCERRDGRWYLQWRGAALMGVINVTPDSFSDGGRFGGPDEAIAEGLRLWREGALIVDVGGESSRPGAEGVGEREERGRVLPVVAGLAAQGVRVSIDTVKPAVAEAAVDAGACLVNDILGLGDEAMRSVCARAGVPAVIMHMQGRPRSMQRAPHYRDVVGEVEAFLTERARRALEDGVPSVLLDPGIGFGKDLEHNLALLGATARLASLGAPLLIGASRKSMIGRLAGGAEPLQRLPGSLALHLRAAEQGAALLRVHDVAEHAQALALLGAVAAAEPGNVRGGEERAGRHG